MQNKKGGGLLFGVLVGTVLGVLFAPRKGKEVRTQLKKEIKEGGIGTETLKKNLKEMGGEIAETAKDMYEKSEMPKHVEKGHKEIKKAWKEAKSEINKAEMALQDKSKELYQKGEEIYHKGEELYQEGTKKITNTLNKAEEEIEKIKGKIPGKNPKMGGNHPSKPKKKKKE